MSSFQSPLIERYGLCNLDRSKEPDREVKPILTRFGEQLRSKLFEKLCTLGLCKTSLDTGGELEVVQLQWPVAVDK